jgi:hypothetical protein
MEIMTKKDKKDYDPKEVRKPKQQPVRGRHAAGGRVGLTHGGGVGIQTHGNKLAKALNTQTPEFSSYINEDGYYKGGIKIRS